MATVYDAACHAPSPPGLSLLMRPLMRVQSARALLVGAGYASGSAGVSFELLSVPRSRVAFDAAGQVFMRIRHSAPVVRHARAMAFSPRVFDCFSAIVYVSREAIVAAEMSCVLRRLALRR